MCRPSYYHHRYSIGFSTAENILYSLARLLQLDGSEEFASQVRPDCLRSSGIAIDVSRYLWCAPSVAPHASDRNRSVKWSVTGGGGASAAPLSALKVLERASFSTENTGNVELDDPDFWHKVVGKPQPVEAATAAMPRKRRCRVRTEQLQNVYVDGAHAQHDDVSRQSIVCG